VNKAPEITPVLPIAGQKYPPYFEGYLEHFHRVSEFLFKKYTICRPTANEVPLKFCWATLDQLLSKASYDN